MLKLIQMVRQINQNKEDSKVLFERNSNEQETT